MNEKDALQDPDYLRFYEWSQANEEEELEFYVNLARQCGPPVLDAACGTGRVAVALAREGVEVVGMESGEAMIERARARLRAEPEEVQERLSIVPGDVRDFDLERQFAAVFLSGAAVFRLQGRLSLSHCFRCLYRHTVPGGMAVVDAVAPTDLTEQPIAKKAVLKEGVNPATGLRTRELSQLLRIHWDMQTVRIEHTYLEGEGDEEQEFVFTRDYRWLRREEGVELLRRAGYPEITALGDYGWRRFEPESPRLILVARRLERDFL
ncbi:MAG: class I SAM-dependent methyltransferase [Planctomycetota bacterium]|jgi:SAM-dependent methyltransferase